MNNMHEDDFNNLLELARLKVSLQEKEFMIKDISSMLSWVKALEEVDT